MKIEALPGDLVPHIDVDISALAELNDSIKLKDVVMPKGVKPLLDEDEVIVVVTPPRTDAELQALEGAVTVDVSAVGAAEAKKAAEDEAAADAAAPAAEKTA